MDLQSLPERSRFNRRRRNLSAASEVIRQALTNFLPQTDSKIKPSKLPTHHFQAN